MFYHDGVYEVLDSTLKNSNFYYELILVASQRNVTTNEFHKFVTNPKMVVVEKSLLEKFNAQKSKFHFGERVRLNGINCVVLWIQYKDYNYYYSVKEKNLHSGSLASWGGWEVEESYLQKT